MSSYDDFLSVSEKVPGHDDKHVVAAALKTQAAVIVTDNIKHFPASVVAPRNIEIRTTDEFIATPSRSTSVRR